MEDLYYNKFKKMYSMVFYLFNIYALSIPGFSWTSDYSSVLWFE